MIHAVEKNRPDVLILLGDIQAKRPLEIELASILDKTDIWFIHGNHDTDSDQDYDNLFGSTLSERNLHCRVVEIAGYRIAGLGGVFRGQVWMPPTEPRFQTSIEFCAKGGKGNLWRGGLVRKHRSTIFPEDYQRLLEQKADILITHEAPSCHPHGIGQVDMLARGLGVTRAFHGHHHDRIEYSAQFSHLNFQAYGVGFCGITDQYGNVIRAGDFDHEPFIAR